MYATAKRKSADWLIGVRPAPFVAHAWVEAEGMPVQESETIEKVQENYDGLGSGSKSLNSSKTLFRKNKTPRLMRRLKVIYYAFKETISSSPWVTVFFLIVIVVPSSRLVNTIGEIRDGAFSFTKATSNSSSF